MMNTDKLVRRAAIGCIVAAVVIAIGVGVGALGNRLCPAGHVPAAPHAQKFGTGQNRALFSLLDSKLVTVTVGARPSSATDGVDITSWRTNGTFTGAMAAVFLSGSATATITSPTGGSSGVELWGYRMSKWWLIAELRDGRDISVTATTGYAQAVNVIGVYDRLAIAGTVSVGSATAQLGPIEAWQ